MTELDIKVRLRDLNLFLQETDYKMIKCYEASMAGEPMPYDFAALKAERDAWREEINVLQNTTPEPYKGPAVVWDYNHKQNKEQQQEE